MKFKIVKINRKNPIDYKLWKDFITEANGATIFHDPDFLSYHGGRFNEHHLGIFKGETLFGIIPMAIVNSKDGKIARSPYGASYGGFIFRSILNYYDSKEIIKLFLEQILAEEVFEIYITPPLSIYHLYGYSETFIFAMIEQGFRIINSDITSVVFLDDSDIENNIFTSRIRNMARKARKARISVVFNGNIDDFWILMEKTFRRHGTLPTHTKKEFMLLMELLPTKIYCNIAYLDSIPVAGVGIFELNTKNIMSFYLCNDERFKQTQALSLLLYESILDAKNKGFKYFDFGTSSVNMQGRENIFRFKESFGAVGLFRHTYRWRKYAQNNALC